LILAHANSFAYFKLSHGSIPNVVSILISFLKDAFNCFAQILNPSLIIFEKDAKLFVEYSLVINCF